MLGKILIFIIFSMSVLSSGLYFYSNQRHGKTLLIGRSLFYAIILSIIIVSSYFLMNIFSHNFQYTYIWDYSSADLQTQFLFSSFYAGNQGSFLLWSLLLSIFGFFIIRYTKKYEGYEPLVMGFFTMILSFILLILIIKSPFEYVWETFKSQGIAVGFKPILGKGLNPILQNLWITIHPPILFSGYAAVAVPFIFALAGLIKRDYTKWVQIAYPWALFAAGILGLGIMMGGFWAYETLGWGGFWGWDPVENSSLIPWLTTVVLVHTMMIQRKTTGLVRTNFVLSILSFLLVLYATFLTRSGVLGSTSVHSFTNPGNSVYAVLVAIQIVFALIAIFIFIIRFKDFGKTKFNFDFKSKEFFILFGSLTILLSAIIIFIGTNWPLILELAGKTKATVDTSYYNNWNLVLTTIIMLFNGISLYLNWETSNFTKIRFKLVISLLISIIATIVLIISGVNELKYIVLAFATIYSLVVNIEYALKKIRKMPLKASGSIAHIGIALLILGVIATAGYSESKTLKIKKGMTKEVLGYKITLIDKIEIEKNLADRQKFIYRLKIEKGSTSSYIDPIVYWSDFNQRKSPIIEPGIYRGLTSDLYAVLRSVDIANSIETIEIIKDSVANFLIDTSNTICITNFDMSHSGMADKNKPLMGVFVKYNINGNEVKDTLFTNLISSSVYTDYIWKKIPNTNVDISFTRLIPDKRHISKSIAIFSFKKSSEKMIVPTETLTVEISAKPFMNFVWLGAIGIAFGFVLSIFKNHKSRKSVSI
jgi:cytochrome c-type biogenesis protein CcmF